MSRERWVNPFYMVWSETSHETRVRHPTFERAQQEAERLARANPGTRFFVLTASGVALVERPSIFTDMRPDADIPF